MSARQEVVLIVEDDPDDRHLLGRAFRKAKVQVPIHFAEDGDEAVSYLSGSIPGAAGTSHPSIVLLDLKLPRRSGFEVLEFLKRHQDLRRIPVVILTSSRESIDVQRAYDLGANSYLVKPARPEALLEMVARINDYWLSLNEPSAVIKTSA
jgi:CheY-like chemotaxis protein